MDDLNELPPGLARALRALDDDAARAAARVDATRVAEGVLRRLREEPAAAPPRRGMSWLRVAAVVGGLAVAGLLLRAVVHDRPGAAMAGLPVDWNRDSLPDTLAANEAEAILAVVEESRADSTAAVLPRTVLLEDLNETELRALLQAMESGGSI